MNFYAILAYDPKVLLADVIDEIIATQTMVSNHSPDSYAISFVDAETEALCVLFCAGHPDPTEIQQAVGEHLETEGLKRWLSKEILETETEKENDSPF